MAQDKKDAPLNTAMKKARTQWVTKCGTLTLNFQLTPTFDTPELTAFCLDIDKAVDKHKLKVDPTEQPKAMDVQTNEKIYY